MHIWVLLNIAKFPSQELDHFATSQSLSFPKAPAKEYAYQAFEVFQSEKWETVISV